MTQLSELSQQLPGQDLKFLGSTPYVYHCHHFNLFHDQTVEDALGEEEGFTIRSRAAQSAAWQLLSDVVAQTGASTPAERLQLAAAVFPWMGQGRLELLAEAGGGAVRGDHLHYSFAWREKYGSRVRRNFPIDAFAAGFAAAATEVAFSLPPGTLSSSEESCFACRQPACGFELERRGEEAQVEPVGREVFLRHIHNPGQGLEEARIAEIATGLNEFLLGVEGDERGLVQGFGIFITRHLSSYYDQTAYDSIHYIEKHAPQATGAVEQLFGESGHVCAFYTIGNILLSPEWEAMVGKLQGEVVEIVSSATAITRALGFGHWTIEELEPDQRLVMRSSSNYESPFYVERYGHSDKPRCYFFANAARAIMQLAHRVEWASRPDLTEDLYLSLFKSGLQWRVEETRCRSKGDETCEVVVTRG
ncbi:MAG: 4-vinyl reductase [Acidobacteriota bacterium]